VARANLNKDPDDVSKMFDGVANRYDFLNDLLSLGRTKAWRKVVTSIIGPKPGLKILDGLRNTSNIDSALKDSLRVTKSGGKIVIAEFSHPSNSIFRFIYLNYLMKAIPIISKKISKNPDAYVYLAESIRAWPNQEGLASKMRDAGWKSVAWQDLTFGIVAVHIGFKG